MTAVILPTKLVQRKSSPSSRTPVASITTPCCPFMNNLLHSTEVQRKKLIYFPKLALKGKKYVELNAFNHIDAVAANILLTYLMSYAGVHLCTGSTVWLLSLNKSVLQLGQDSVGGVTTPTDLTSVIWLAGYRHSPEWHAHNTRPSTLTEHHMSCGDDSNQTIKTTQQYSDNDWHLLVSSF